MDYHIEKVASANAEVGEGPVWNPDEKKVYWTDICLLYTSDAADEE